MILSPKPFKVKMKNSSIIEKLQANLTLCPSSLLPSVPRTPELKLQTAPPSPPCTSPGHTASPLLSPYGRQSSEDEEGVSFESPPEGSPLPSFNKTRARLSFKRRPPSRLHRRSLGEEAAAAAGNGLSPWQPEAERDEGAELSERMSCDPAAPPNQSEVKVDQANGRTSRSDEHSPMLPRQHPGSNGDAVISVRRDVSPEYCKEKAVLLRADPDDTFDSSSFVIPRNFSGSFRLNNQVLDASSNQSQVLASQLQEKLSGLYSDSPALARYFSSAEIHEIRNNSTEAVFSLRFLLPPEDQEQLQRFTLSRELVYNVLRQFLYDQEADPLQVDPKSLQMT
ncbi:hypothetical protein NHX12_008550 [Muraenolepis orangiensis]|uniref:SEA domain-containing protein n=1 Tax=Muraenolepis orangiensis TaxID=630683 RepID=A0A9Q0DP21_9TELE|nr:hypothetical protein NHX12_008550 [Muraenolepis orangiensis]